jgi:hypothetical protein
MHKPVLPLLLAACPALGALQVDFGSSGELHAFAETQTFH